MSKALESEKPVINLYEKDEIAAICIGMEKRSVKVGFHTSPLFILHVLCIVCSSEPEDMSDIKKAHRYHIDMPSETMTAKRNN